MRRLLLSTLLAAAAAAPAAYCIPSVALSCGQAQQGNVTIDGTNYGIGAQAGDTILVRLIALQQNVNVNPLVLNDPTGFPVKSRGGDSEKTFLFLYDLQVAGTYQLTINGPAGASGSYLVVYVPVNRPCLSNTGLSCGVPVKGTLAPGEMRAYQFSGRTGDAVSFLLARSDTTTQVAPLVFDSTTHFQGFASNQSSASYRLTTDGQQTYVIIELTGTTKANFAARIIDFSSPCGAGALACGTAVDGSIGDILAAGIFSVSASKGDLWALRLITTDHSGGLTAGVALVDPQGNLVTPSTTSDPTRLQYSMPADGQYLVLVQDTNGSGTGKYTVAVARLNRPCSNAQAVACGSVMNGQVNGTLRLVTYSLASQAGDTYLLRLLRGGSSGSFTPTIEIYAPDGGRVQSLTTAGLDSAPFSTAASGAYTLVAWDVSGTESGAYTAWVARLNRPCEGSTTLPCGVLVSGALNQPLQAGLYSYPTNPGDAFTVRAIDTGGGVTSTVQVYDPSGRAVSVASGNPAVNSPGGAYTILVTDQNRTAQPHTYAIEALSTNGACGAPLSIGQPVNGLVSGPAPFSAYTFPAAQGEPILLRLASYTANFTAAVDLYGPTGSRVDSNTFSILRPAPATGTYTAIVGASAPRAAGTYAVALQLLDQPVAPPLSCGQTISGVLGAGSQFWYYIVSAANDSELLKLLLTRVPSAVNAQVEIFNAGGKLALNGTDITVGAGDYLVAVSPATASAESGGFALALQMPKHPCNAQALTCGQTILQQVAAPGQLDAYSFSSNPGDQLAIQVAPRAGSITPVTDLYAPSGRLVSGTTAINTTASEAGEYTLTVHDRGGNTGSYRVGLQHAAPNACPEDDTQKPTVSLRRPTGGEVIAGGFPYLIAWQSDDNVAVASHSLRLSLDGGQTFAPLPGGPGTLSGVTQSYSWAVPPNIQPSRTAIIQVTATDKGGNTQSAASDLLTLVGSGFTANESVTLQYDPLNRVTSAIYQGGPTIQYVYDSGGNLVQVIVQ